MLYTSVMPTPGEEISEADFPGAVDEPLSSEEVAEEEEEEEEEDDDEEDVELRLLGGEVNAA